MDIDKKTLHKRLEEFVEDCKRIGLKATHQRMEIFREVISTEEHPDTETILKRVRRRMPTISRNTVYSSLQTLAEHGLIATMGIHHDRRRFDGNIQPHHHLVCTRCGKVSDFESPEYLELPLFPGDKTWGNIQTAHVELRGICSDCLKKEKK